MTIQWKSRIRKFSIWQEKILKLRFIWKYREIFLVWKDFEPFTHVLTCYI